MTLTAKISPFDAVTSGRIRSPSRRNYRADKHTSVLFVDLPILRDHHCKTDKKRIMNHAVALLLCMSKLKHGYWFLISYLRFLRVF